MCGLSLSSLGNSGHDFPGQSLPLTIWFRAMWYITSQKTGVNALGFHRALGLGSYPDGMGTALQAAARCGASRTRHTTESYRGRRNILGWQGRRGCRAADGKEIFDYRGSGERRGRYRAGVIAVYSGCYQKHPVQFIAQAVEPGSMVRTDGLKRLLWVSQLRRCTKHCAYTSSHSTSSGLWS